MLAAFAFKNIGKTAAIIYENAAAGIDCTRRLQEVFRGGGRQDPGRRAGGVRPDQLSLDACSRSSSVKPDLVFIGVTQSHAPFAEQVGQMPGFPVAIGTTFSRPFFGFPATMGWYHSAILSGTTPSDEKEFNAKFGTKEMGFFAREYSNSTDIILQAIDHVLGEGQAAHRRHHQATRSSRSRPSSPASPTSPSTSNTAVRPVEIYTARRAARASW